MRALYRWLKCRWRHAYPSRPRQEPSVFTRHFRHARLYTFYYLAVFLSLILVLGLVYRQLVLGHKYREREERQSQRRVLYPAARGEILDRHHGVLAGNRAIFSAVVDLHALREEFRQAYYNRVRALREAHQAHGGAEPFRFNWMTTRLESRVEVLRKYLDTVNGLLGTSYQLSFKAARRHFRESFLLPFPLVKHLQLEHYALLVQGLPLNTSIDIHATSVRAYPQGGDIATHLLGYVRREKTPSAAPEMGEGLRTFSYGTSAGVNGLEKFFNTRLQGKSGGEIWIVDRFQFPASLAERTEGQMGKSLVSSIDSRLQKVAKEALATRKGAIVVVKVDTGEVLALVSSPSYDLGLFTQRLSPKQFKTISEQGAWFNRAVQGFYPPGSIFKIITALAALRAGLDPYALVDCPSFFKLGSHRFSENRSYGHGAIDLITALSKSSNVYFYQLGYQLGARALIEEAKRWGFGQNVAIELPHLGRGGLVPDEAWMSSQRQRAWQGGDTVNLSIGQGDLLVSPLQMAAFIASLARGQTHTPLTLLRKDDGALLRESGESSGLSPTARRALLEGLSGALQSGGTAYRARVPDLPTAGKTSSAQTHVDGKRSTVAWFAAFAPLEKPEIAIVVMVEPEGGEHLSGGVHAAPLAKKVLLEYLKHKR